MDDAGSGGEHIRRPFRTIPPRRTCRLDLGTIRQDSGDNITDCKCALISGRPRIPSILGHNNPQVKICRKLPTAALSALTSRALQRWTGFSLLFNYSPTTRNFSG
jgi:hypothetical protein